MRTLVLMRGAPGCDDYIKKDIISLREDFFKDNPQIKNSY